MAQMNYLTACTFDFGALAQLPKVLKGLGVSRPFVVSDPGLKANGLVETEVIAQVTSRLIVNRTALKTRPEAIGGFIARVRAGLSEGV